MKIVSGYFVYRAYLTYKAHFGSNNTNIAKYNFALFKPPYDQFIETGGKSYYDRIAKRLQTEEKVIKLFIAAFLHDNIVWIGDIAENLNKYIGLMEDRNNLISNMPYVFAKECKILLEEGMKFDRKTIGSFVFDRVMNDTVHIETFIILKKILKFEVDNNLNYDYLYNCKYEKYELLMTVNTKKYKSILEEVIMDLRE